MGAATQRLKKRITSVKNATNIVYLASTGSRRACGRPNDPSDFGAVNWGNGVPDHRIFEGIGGEMGTRMPDFGEKGGNDPSDFGCHGGAWLPDFVSQGRGRWGRMPRRPDSYFGAQ